MGIGRFGYSTAMSLIRPCVGEGESRRGGGGVDKMGGRRKGWSKLTERRAWRTRWGHTVEYGGKMDSVTF